MSPPDERSRPAGSRAASDLGTDTHHGAAPIVLTALDIVAFTAMWTAVPATRCEHAAADLTLPTNRVAWMPDLIACEGCRDRQIVRGGDGACCDHCGRDDRGPLVLMAKYALPPTPTVSAALCPVCMDRLAPAAGRTRRRPGRGVRHE